MVLLLVLLNVLLPLLFMPDEVSDPLDRTRAFKDLNFTFVFPEQSIMG